VEESGWARVRHALTAIEGKAAPIYGLSGAVAMALPLLVGALTHNAPAGVIVSLGAFMVAARAPEGTYGQKARSLAIVVSLVTAGSLLGGLISGHRWTTVAVVPPLAFLGVLIPRIGPTAALATLLAGIRVPVETAWHSALLSALGAGFMAALVLTPWPGRRLRPLHEAFAEVTQALAGLLDEVTVPPGDPAWDKARRAASDSIARLRTTYGVYQVSSADAHPARLLRSLVKLMHETVALRAVIDAEDARPLHGEATVPETRAAIAVVAARVRRLADEITRTSQRFGPWLSHPLSLPTAIAAPTMPSPGDVIPPRMSAPETPPPPVAAEAGRPTGTGWGDGGGGAVPTAFQRLEQVVGEARREAFTGDEDILAVALAAQAERSLRRLVGIVEQARRIVAGGIMLRPALRLPETPRPSSLWARLRAFPRRQPNLVRQALRSGITMLIAMMIWASIDIPHGHWLPLTAMLVLRGTYGETLRRVWQRIGGTVLGAVIAALVLAATPGQIGLTVIIFLLALIGFALTPMNYAFWILLNTPMMLLVVDFGQPVPWTTATERVGLTLLGTLIALVAARVLWPTAYLGRLPVSLAEVCNSLAGVLRAAEVPGEEGEAAFVDKARAAREAVTSVQIHVNRIAQDPDPDTELVGRLREAMAAAHRIRDEVIAVAGMARTSSGPIAGILDELADYLEEAGEMLDSGSSADLPAPELDDLYTEFDERLSALAKERRAEVAGGAEMDDTSPLRRDLLSVAAVRHALRALRVDVTELGRLALSA